MSTESLTQSLKSAAAELGFELAAACPAVDAPGFANFIRWLQAGYAGEMSYLESRQEAYQHPRHVLEGCQSVLVLATSYYNGTPYPSAHCQSATTHEPTNNLSGAALNGAGRVARYALGDGDYHDVIHARLKKLKRIAQDLAPDAAVRGVVDTAPLLEREFAQLAGLGWVGKNTLLLNRQLGSWFFLAALLLDVSLEYDTPFASDHCGTCDACLRACPTDAFVAPRVLDASRCISYLTIEHRSAIPAELRSQMGDWLFGCDVCQDVCPWNRKATAAETAELLPPAAKPDPAQLPLAELFELDDEQFRQRYRKTPFWRIRRRGLLRNAAIVLGNQQSPDSLAPLTLGLADPEPLVRAASAWALGQLQNVDDQVQRQLAQRRNVESDPAVLEEIQAQLATLPQLPQDPGEA